jgi:release factor glutamine methyltransferase
LGARSLNDGRQSALVALGRALRDGGYRFVTPTPETHRRVLQRSDRARAHDLRDVFGWSLPFVPQLLSAEMLALCETAGILAPGQNAGELISKVRFSTLSAATGEYLFVHSAYPTTGPSAVFFGPDSYRFAAFLTRTVWKGRRLVDVGCGTGVGGLVLAARVDDLVLADINPSALELAAVNIALAGRDAGRVSLCASDVLAQVPGDVDVVVSNPPYLVEMSSDAGGPGRLYRDGGGSLGIDLAMRIAVESLQRLAGAGGGQLVIYTGVPIIDGRNPLQDRLEPELRAVAASWSWEELDPDVFGEELERPPYRHVERIAVVGLVATVAG